MILFVLPAFLFAVYTQSRVKSTFDYYSRIPSRSRLTGAQVAQRLLEHAGIDNVSVTRVEGLLTDHYDPGKKKLRLSGSVFASNSLAAIGVAAHETGHAIQHNRGYFPLGLRNSLVPAANFGSRLALPLFILGFFFSGQTGGLMMDIGISLFAFAVLFQIVTLPVEFNASSRAVALLQEHGYLEERELEGARKVLSAAALTYVAATAVALAQLLRLVLLRGGRE